VSVIDAPGADECGNLVFSLNVIGLEVLAWPPRRLIASVCRQGSRCGPRVLVLVAAVND